jgi:catechol 2,3-dioxygenase-like lactoylglutathione lyase family enzyme
VVDTPTLRKHNAIGTGATRDLKRTTSGMLPPSYNTRHKEAFHMLKEAHAVLPAADLQRAREFYHNALELDPDEVHEGMLTYHPASGSAFDIYETTNAGSAKNTQMCWVADDLNSEMARLRKRGVQFEDYDIPGMKTENGVATIEDTRTAWFRDSEGNFLCITEITS